MRVFLDFEASSLGDDSYPIEVGWVAEDGVGEAHLIRPPPQWTDWDPTAEALHGLSRDRLLAEGEPHAQVARRVFETLREHAVYASAPTWDGKWLSVLLRSAGIPRHAMRLKDSDEAHLQQAAEILRSVCTEAETALLSAELLHRVRERFAAEPPRHRALADAEQEREIWIEIGRLAKEEAINRAT